MQGGLVAIWETFLGADTKTKTPQGSQRIWEVVDNEFEGRNFTEVHALYDLALSCKAPSAAAATEILRSIRYWLRKAESESSAKHAESLGSVFAGMALLECLALRRYLSESSPVESAGSVSLNEAEHLLFLSYLRSVALFAPFFALFNLESG